MENATKALVMAGGVLLAVMVLATLLYAASYWGIFTVSDDNANAIEQLSKFNMEYESYARYALYGTDLLSVLNKAMDYNEKNNLSPSDKDLYMDVKFTLINDTTKKTTKYYQYIDGSIDIPDGQPTYETGALVGKKQYCLSDDNDNKKIKMFINELYGSKKKTKTSIDIDKEKKYIEYLEEIAEGTEFKARLFKCEVSYNNEGRVNCLTFQEQKVDELDKLEDYTQIENETIDDIDEKNPLK